MRSATIDSVLMLLSDQSMTVVKIGHPMSLVVEPCIDESFCYNADSKAVHVYSDLDICQSILKEKA